MADSHSIMPKKLAMALMEAGVQHFDAGGQAPNMNTQNMFSTKNAQGQNTVMAAANPIQGLADAGTFGGKNSFINQNMQLLNPMSALSGIFGGATNNFQATGPQQTSQNFAPRIQQQQQNQNNVYNQQQNLANTLLQQSQGGGPNPAMAALNQQTGANVANQAALMAGQRGASSNPGLIARQAAMQGGALQQQAVGQGASMQAQQQLAAQQQLQAQQQAMQQAALQGESIEQGGAASQNTANMAAQGLNAQVAGQNAAGNKGLLGGIMGGITGALGLSKGGEVPRYADGGSINTNYSMASMPAGYQEAPEVNGWYGDFLNTQAKKDNPDGQKKKKVSLFADGGDVGANYAATPSAAMSPSGGDDKGSGGGIAGLIPLLALLANGGNVPGHAEVKGNSKENDVQPALLSPGEIVLPRSVTQAPDMEKKAIAFLRHLKSGKKKSYKDVVEAKACGGKV